MKTFLERLEDPEPLVFDGGFGTELFIRGIELTNSALANELHPDAVADIHSVYIEAGANVVGTNTFVASFPHLEMAGKDASGSDKLVRLAVKHAKTAIEKSGKEIYIAGSIGPLPGAIEADSGDTEFGIANDIARDAHERVATALAEEGVDFFCIETMFSSKEAALATDVIRKLGLPIAVNSIYKYTKDKATENVIYRTDWGHSAEDLLEIFSSGELSNGDDLLDAVNILGVNCGAESRREEHTGMPYAINGVRNFKEAMEKKGIRPKRLMAYPNAGKAHLDNKHRTYYTQSPEEMVSYLPELFKAGAYIIGGCCGTGPAHIKEFRDFVNGGTDLVDDSLSS